MIRPVMIILMVLLTGWCGSATATPEEEWVLPWANPIPNSEELVRYDIENVLKAFQELDESYQISMKMVEHRVEGASGSIARYYFHNGRVVMTQVLTAMGANSTESAYYDQHGEVRLVINEAHSSSWAQTNYQYWGVGRTWEFTRHDDITYPDDSGIGQSSNKGKSLAQTLKEFSEDGPLFEAKDGEYMKRLKAGWAKDLATLQAKAKAEELNLAATRFWKGTLNWKYPIVLELEIHPMKNDGLWDATQIALKGRYRYKSGSGDLNIMGHVQEDRLRLNEYDAAGKITGIWVGRFTTKDEIEGRWSDPDQRKTLYIDLEATESYSFD